MRVCTQRAARCCLVLVTVAATLESAHLRSTGASCAGVQGHAMPPLRLRGAGRRAGMASGHGVWVEQANWAEEWEKVNGHDLRRLRATV